MAQDNHSLDRSDRADLLRAIRQETWDRIRRILTPGQREQLGNASQASRASGQQLALLNRVVHLNEEQRETIRPLLDSEDLRIDQINENRSLDRDEKATQIKAVKRSTWRKVDRLLTVGQLGELRNSHQFLDRDGDHDRD